MLRLTLPACAPLCALLLAACGDKDDGPTEDTALPACDDADDDGVCDAADCDPDDPYTYPGANDIPYDGKDNDCAGDGDLVDVDGDGFVGVNGGGDDCNDGNPTVYPGAAEVCYDGIDQDCGGTEDSTDCDGDGFDGRGDNASDCDDEDPSIYPGAEEIWYNGVNNDCSNYLDSDYDADGDGDDHEDYGGTDCDDTDPLTAGGNAEIWDGRDRNCDGTLDGVDLGDGFKVWVGDKGVDDGWLGMGLAVLDDYDGDGWATLAASGYGSADGGNDGVLYLLDVGDEDGQPVKVAHAVITGAEGEFFGMDVANVGDLDGDGLDELLAGGPLVGGSGEAVLFLGSDLAGGGALTTADAHASLSGNDYVGLEVTGLGDVDGDGINDLAAGTGWLGPTHIMVYSGADAVGGGSLSAIHALAQIDADGGYGGMTAWGPDLDGDGRAEVLAPGATATFGYIAPINAVDASMGTQILLADVPYIRGEDSSSGLGLTTGWLADITGDGYAELVLRAYNQDGDATESGVLYLVNGDQLPTTEDLYAADLAFATVAGTQTYGHLGSAERGADFDGDGLEDLLVHQSGDREMAWSQEGDTGVLASLQVLPGAALAAGGAVSLADGAMALGISGSNDDDLLGYGNALGDLDGDGDPDLAVGAPAAFAGAGYLFVLLNQLSD